ncbi:RHS repeat-associated core domain-containing protein, partial [Aquisphaera insulae]|uniref:RHS repeat-associated core domain-containing protein n=1 Tax=Aquisphaera insulae TaxID=2712864 RepID=UPI0027145FF4
YRNRLTGVSVGGTATATYTYDALDRRIGTNLSGTQTWTVYDDTNAYADFNSAGTLQNRYTYGPAVDELLARTSSGGTTAWYLSDRLGTVRDIASSAGAVIYHASYDSYGKVLAESGGASGDRFKYAGMEYDAAIALYYDNARYYDPAVGRFTALDPIGLGGGDPNFYRYVGNGPTNATDPTGLAAATANTEVVDGSGIHKSPFQPSPGDTFPSETPPGGWEIPWWEAVKGGAGSIWDNTVGGLINEGGTVWQNTGGSGMSTPERIYTTVGTTVATVVGVRQLDDAFHEHDAVDGHKQSVLERVGDGVGGSLQLVSTAIGISGAIKSAGPLIRSGECFAAGTPLITPDGSNLVENLRVGDLVLSRDQNNPYSAVVAKRIRTTFESFAPILEIWLGGQVIRTTAKHPFWVEGKGWVEAEQLRQGDLIRGLTADFIAVQKVEGPREPASVYNVEVEDFHTYFIGDTTWGFAVWAHNADCFDWAIDYLQKAGTGEIQKITPITPRMPALPGYPVPGQPSPPFFNHAVHLENGILRDPAHPGGIPLEDWIDALKTINKDPDVMDLLRWHPWNPGDPR